MHAWLVQPVHPSTLGVFRVLFGLCMVKQARHFAHMYDDFVTSKLLLSYAGFGWIPLVGPATGDAILVANLAAAILVTIGFRTREASVVLCATFTYLFVQCESFFNNHYILICHATLVASMTEWGRWASVDAAVTYCRRVQQDLQADLHELHELREVRRRGGGDPSPPLVDSHSGAPAASSAADSIPYWNLLVLQLLLSVPYSYGAIAKMNEDWLLRAQPLKSWFSPGRPASLGVPLGLGTTWWWPWFIAWGGFAFDAAIVPLLFSRPLRPLAFAGAITFNCMNKLMFNIGVFPYAMLSMLVLFLEPHAFSCDPGAVLTRPSWHWWWMLPEWGPVTARAAAHPGVLASHLREGVKSSHASPAPLACICRCAADSSAAAAAAHATERGPCSSAGFAERFDTRGGWDEERGALGGGLAPGAECWNARRDTRPPAMPRTPPRSTRRPGFAQPLSLRQLFLLGWLGGLGCFHALWPLRHLVLYPAGVSWHEEGHLHAWHMKLRSKHGWVVVHAVEADGLRTDFSPSHDMYITADQRKKIIDRPHAFLLWATHLAWLHMAAGRNLTSLHAHSCFSLNGRPHASLYGPPESNLLAYLGRYELIPPFGTTAVGKWLMPMPPAQMPQAEQCSRVPPPEYSSREMAASMRDLHLEAGFRTVGSVLLASDGQPAYMQRHTVVDEELAGYLARAAALRGDDAIE